MRKLANIKELGPAINRCYNDYHASNGYTTGAFKYYLERIAGLKIEFDAGLASSGGWRVSKAEIVDEVLYLMWLLKWS